MKFFSKVFGSRNERLVKKMFNSAEKVTALEEDFKALSDDELKAKTDEFKQRVEKGEKLNALIPEAFATVREAGLRVLGMRHFDVQLIGGMVLNQGKIAEMRTGEGKTLVATLAAYLNALSAKGVHVITVNDYLARRDGEWMGRLYHFLGLSVGIIQSSSGNPDTDSFLYDDTQTASENGQYLHLSHCTRKQAYEADITYGTNNEFGFDYLRDNMAFSAEQRSQRGLNFAIVDEVDSILIDEARTPLIISGPTEGDPRLYTEIDKIIPSLTAQEAITNEEGKPDWGPGDYAVDEKSHAVYLSDEGHEHIEETLIKNGLLEEGSNLYDTANISLMHHVTAALRAHKLFKKDVHYIVRDNEIVIVDEFTGRTMPGRRWSDGLHQAVEAKEGVEIQKENQTLASITFQNYFRLYNKLSGMTGTADTEAFELQQIYGLEVVVIPTNMPMIRDDMTDLVFLTQKEKFEAIIEDIRDCIKRGQPVLVGTASIEASELVHHLLDQRKISHEVLNAKQHEREAHIIEQAGRPGSVTIATNMAGRGTDIVLGGSLEAELNAQDSSDDSAKQRVQKGWDKRQKQVIKAGGLHVVGTERHESRRIDNQLRGRSGRQGDPGSSRFYLSLEDDLMRIFASEKVSGLMQRLGMKDGEAIEHPWVNRAIENAQRKVEGRNFDIRKSLLEYDDVANDQRKVIYTQRAELMEVEDISESIENMCDEVVNVIIDNYIPPQSLEEQWNVPGLEAALNSEFGLELDLQKWLDEEDDLHEEPLRRRILDEMLSSYKEKETHVGSERMRQFEKAVLLETLDSYWKEHLASMDYLRQGIHLRGYAQKNPKQEYKREAFEMFTQLLENIKVSVVQTLLRVKIQEPQDTYLPEHQLSEMELMHEEITGFTDSSEQQQPQQPQEQPQQPYVRDGRKIGRNEPCPCGSGKKYKQCHGRLA